MEFITTARGLRKLCYDGHAYTFKAKSKTTQRWECSQRRGKQCRAMLTIDLEETVVKSVTEHCHEKDDLAVQALSAKSDIMTSMKDSRGSTSQVIIDKLAKYPKEVAVAAGSMQTLKRFARRHKQISKVKDPASVREIPIPLPDMYAVNLIYDNHSSSKRILVYASDDGLRLMCNSTTWFMDGTHSTAPSQFQQIFCVRTALGDSYQSVAYALLPSKTQQTYEECFTALLDACLTRDIRPNPETVVVDYEMAIHNALRTSISSNIHIQGCFYHLTQSTWRHLQSEGLQTVYRDDETVRHFCGMLDGLAFLPVGDVKTGMRALRDVAPPTLIGLVDYFDATYVNGAFRTVLSANGMMEFRRTDPLFHPETWSVHDATMTSTARTNNVCEGWNNGFRSLVGHKNPSLWTVIDCFQKDMAIVEADILRYSMGLSTDSRRKTVAAKHQKVLLTLCRQYVKGEKSVAEFLYAIGQHIRIKKLN